MPDLERLRIAVLSDLHIGEGARTADLCPSGGGPALRVPFKKLFLDFVSQASIRANYLLIPGDITSSCQSAEIDAASDFLAEIAVAMEVPEQCIAWVPGNHDVDWAVLQVPQSPEIRWQQRYDPWRHGGKLFATAQPQAGTILDPPFVGAWTAGQLSIVGYNSACQDRPETTVHHGVFKPEHLPALDALASELGTGAAQVRVFMVHHHPVAQRFAVPGAGQEDFSLLQNARSMLHALRQWNFDLLVHGHAHQPSFEVQQIDGGNPIAVLGAGSFCGQLPGEWHGSINNVFHLIHIDGRHPETGHVVGCVRTWAFYPGHGWLPSREPADGMEHREPFGWYPPGSLLADRLRVAVSALLAEGPHFNLDSLAKLEPTVGYLRPGRVTETLGQLAAELGFFAHGSSLSDMIWVRNE